MKRKLQVILSDEAWTTLEQLTKEANEGFKAGCISMSDVVNEILPAAKLDIRALQAKHTNIRRSLRLLASQDDIDVDSAIRQLMELKSRSIKRGTKASTAPEESAT